MIRAKGGNINAMSGKGWFQCQSCGSLHQLEVQFNIEEDLYVQVRCEHCKKMTDHLWVGDDKSELYSMYNVNVDPRYYKYNTK